MNDLTRPAVATEDRVLALAGARDPESSSPLRRSNQDLYALAGFVVAGGVHLSGVAGSWMYPIITSSAVVLAVIGLRRHRPEVRWPWLALLAVGVMWTIAGISRESTHAFGDLSETRSFVPDFFALPGYLVFGIAVYGFVRQRDSARDLDAMLDAILLTAGAGLIGHEVLIGPTLDLAEASVLTRWAIVIYPTVSTCMLFLASRIAFDTRGRRRGLSFIVAGTFCLALGDIVFALGEIGRMNVSQATLELPYLATAAFFGCVALNPDLSAGATDVPARRPVGMDVNRLAALLLALFAPLVVVATPNDGKALWVQVALYTLLAVTAVTRIVRAVKAQERLQAELLEQATHDELTGLPTRSLVLDDIVRRLTGDSSSVCVLFLDLDDFKLVNDSMGHGAGDDLLVRVAERLRSAVRAADLVGRISGDEFVVVTDHAGLDGAQRLGDRLRGCLRRPFRLESGEVFASASIGIAARAPGVTQVDSPIPFIRESERDEVDEPRRLAAQLMQQADTAMYRSKERGKNVTTVFDDSMTERVQIRLETERDLRTALELDQISVVYQPIVHAETGRIESFEALMRWTIDGRTVSPAQFIPVAEECGLIVPLGSFVLHEACRQLAWWRSHVPGAENVTVSVNLSPRQVLSSDIVDVTKAALDDHDLPGEALWLEITETTLMEDTVTTSAIMQGLRGLGVRLAIDDFGTGFSSLSYLRQFPVSRVKIDRGFVSGIGHIDSDSSLVEAIVAMARALGLDTVAEGVETPEQAQLLSELGCHRLQGYLFSPGVPPTEVVELMVELDGAIKRGLAQSRRCRTTARPEPGASTTTDGD